MTPAAYGYHPCVRCRCLRPASALTAMSALSAVTDLAPARGEYLTLAKVAKVMPLSKAPCASAGWFLGRPLIAVGTVLRRLGLAVQISGTDDPSGPLRLDSPPAVRSDGGELMWVTFAVMPSSLRNEVSR